MGLISATILFGMFWTVNCEIHSLSYIYTALSKPVALPGVHDFTAMGLLDGRMIDYFDSANKKKIPKQTWMEDRMEPDYWDKGTQSRKSKEQWFKVNVDILMDRMRQNNSDLHVLQWRHGCTVDKQKDSVRFMEGIDQYSYDGEDFLAFDPDYMRWIAPATQAQATKNKWDNVPILNQYTKGYLEKECVEWLKKFVTYGDDQLKKASPPVVYSFAKKAKISGRLVLTCMATGFLPKEVTLEIRKNKLALAEGDLTSTGVRPNDDDTFQIRKSTEIPHEGNNDYDCYVNHETLRSPIIQKWDNKCMDCSTNVALTAGITVLVVLLLVGLVLGILYKNGRIGFLRSASSNEKKSVESPPVCLQGQVVADPLLPSAPQMLVGFAIANGTDEPLLTDENKENGSDDSDSGNGSGPSLNVEASSVEEQ